MDKVKKLLKRVKGIPKKKKILLVVALFLLVSCVCVYHMFFLRNLYENNDFNPTEVVMYSTDRPSEKNIVDFDVPADMPKRINLTSIGKSGYIQIVGIDQNGDIAVPSNVLLAGWYINSVRPGDFGLSIITGHRDGVVKKGVFRYLGDLKKGDKFEIEYGDSSLRYFKVVEVKSVSIDEAYELLYEKKDEIENQLNLVTCTGAYDRENETYDKRIIVVSEKVR